MEATCASQRRRCARRSRAAQLLPLRLAWLLRMAGVLLLCGHAAAPVGRQLTQGQCLTQPSTQYCPGGKDCEEIGDAQPLSADDCCAACVAEPE
jgi:hypothetical protein